MRKQACDGGWYPSLGHPTQVSENSSDIAGGISGKEGIQG